MHRPVQLLIAVAAAASSRAMANSIVTSLLLPFNDPGEFVGTVLGMDQTATTFAYTCASDVDPDDCGMQTPGTVIQGPSTWQLTMSQSDDEYGVYVMTAACALTSSIDEANCVISASESDTDTNFVSTTSGATTAYLSEMQPVTLIDGLDKLSGGAAPTATVTAPTATATAQGGNSSGAGSSGAQTTASNSSPGASSSSASKSTGAAPAVTQQALLAGVAAVAGALVL